VDRTGTVLVQKQKTETHTGNPERNPEDDTVTTICCINSLFLTSKSDPIIDCENANFKMVKKNWPTNPEMSEMPEMTKFPYRYNG
jgi:hypothetical protein